ncbi:MAG TPA: hypothetical protein VFE65_28390 [Pseudonocardia sp.]|jgi:tight adherence protein B|nr:hypothetical protein [Pseudonocardia sp.]
MVTPHLVTASGWPAALLVLDASLLCFPAGIGRHRLTTLMAQLGSPTVPNRLFAALWGRLDGPGSDVTRTRRFVVASAALGAAFGAVLGGPGASVAGAMAAGLAGHRLGAQRARRCRSRELALLVDALGVMGAELRAGSHPATAASAAADAVTRRSRTDGPEGGGVQRVLRLVAAGSKLGADVPAMLRRHAAGEPAISAELARLAAAWSLTERHGVGFAQLLEAVRTDLDSRQRLAGQVQAQLAGPRSTSAVLAGLPALGIVLGQGIGANPWHVLSSTLVGQALLVIGVGLACAGVVWSERITGKAVAG